MQLSLPFGREQKPASRDLLTLGRQAWPVTYTRHRRARHYVLRLADDGSVRVTIPRGGTRTEAERFAKRQADWITRERYRRVLAGAGGWVDGAAILLRGQETTLEVDAGAGTARLGPEVVRLPAGTGPDVRDVVSDHLRRLAERELPARLAELARVAGLRARRVAVRNQKSRWGSCSPRGDISLNWRLIQVPASVRDYVILHELAHLDHPNHSARFWKRLEEMCPWQREARAWLKVRFSGTMRDPFSPHP